MIRKRLRYWLYGKCPGFAGSFPYYGTRIYFPKGSLGFRATCEQGIFEADNVGLLRKLVRPNTTYFDVGANIGLMAVPILDGCPNCMVVSFEPSPNALPYLRRTVAESHFGDRWTVIPRALSDFEGQAEFYVVSKEWSMFEGLRDTHRVTASGSVTVGVSTVDVEWGRLDRPRVSVMKCDVEGGELSILHGAGALIERDRPFVLVEWNRENLRAYDCDPAEILAFCDGNAYRLFGVPNFVEVNSVLDLSLQMTVVETFLLAPAK
jgi:FkbM family methyltransferase